MLHICGGKFILQPHNNIAAFIHLLLYSIHQLSYCPLLSDTALRRPFFLKLAGYLIKISVKSCLITGNHVGTSKRSSPSASRVVHISQTGLLGL